MTDPDSQSLLEANRAFYRAFLDRDADAMADLWARNRPVACIHPGWDALHGREEIIRSWRRILANAGAPKIRFREEAPYVYGDIGFVICHEVLDQGVLVATNIFAREDGDWRLVHHQASPLAAPARQSGPAPGERLH